MPSSLTAHEFFASRSHHSGQYYCFQHHFVLLQLSNLRSYLIHLGSMPREHEAAMLSPSALCLSVPHLHLPYSLSHPAFDHLSDTTLQSRFLAPQSRLRFASTPVIKLRHARLLQLHTSGPNSLSTNDCLYRLYAEGIEDTQSITQGSTGGF